MVRAKRNPSSLRRRASVMGFASLYPSYEMRMYSGPSLSAANALLQVGRRSARAEVARAGRTCCDAFPRTDRFDDDIYSGHGAVDLALHVVDLGLQEVLHFLQLGNQLAKFVDRICGQPGNGGADFGRTRGI